MKDEYNGILLKSKTAGEALRGMFYTAKAHSSKWSLGKLSKQTGIKSKGFLSDMMAQKKRVNPAQVENLAQALRLDSDQEKVFRLLSEKDQTENEQTKIELDEKLFFARKTLKIKKLTATSEMKNLLLMLEIYSLINMHKKGMTYQKIQDYFKEIPFDILQPTLGRLIKANLVEQEAGNYQATGESFMFGGSDDNHSHLDFLKACISKSLSEIECWFDKGKESHIESSLITVNTKRYQEKLPHIKDKLLDIQKELDDDDPDMILRFNVQIIPGKKPINP